MDARRLRIAAREQRRTQPAARRHHPRRRAVVTAVAVGCDDALPNFNVPVAAVGEVRVAKQQQRAAGGGSVVLDLGRARLERRRRGFRRAQRFSHARVDAQCRRRAGRVGGRQRRRRRAQLRRRAAVAGVQLARRRALERVQPHGGVGARRRGEFSPERRRAPRRPTRAAPAPARRAPRARVEVTALLHDLKCAPRAAAARRGVARGEGARGARDFGQGAELGAGGAQRGREGASRPSRSSRRKIGDLGAPRVCVACGRRVSDNTSSVI